MIRAPRIVVFPRWDARNPYLNVVYLASRGRGVETSGATNVADLEALMRDHANGDLLHVHWTAPIVQSAATEAEALDRFDRFCDIVTSARADGGRLVWTIHNQVPHEMRYADLEDRLYAFLAQHADAIHIMNPATSQMVSQSCQLDSAKVVQIPHPSYQGIYEARQSTRVDARRRLGIAPGRPTVMFFGQIRAYKGLESLFSAFRMMIDSGGPLPLLILAGSASDEMKSFVEAELPPTVDSVQALRFIDDDEVDTWFGAADLAVYPYRAILNSGSIHLAATFGVPCVLPGEDHLKAAYGGEPWVRWFDPERPVEGLAEVLSDADSYLRPVEDMRAFSDRLSPWRVSRQFSELFEKLGV